MGNFRQTSGGAWRRNTSSVERVRPPAEAPVLDPGTGRWPAVTIRQPWAWLMFRIPVTPGRCLMLPRPFESTYRGPMLIHAGTQILREEWEAGEREAAEYGIEMPRAVEMVRGAVVGAGILIRMSRASARMWNWELGHLFEMPEPIRMPGQFDVWTATIGRLRCCGTFTDTVGAWTRCTRCGRPFACSHRTAVQRTMAGVGAP
jgi:hypothetical protein